MAQPTLVVRVQQIVVCVSKSELVGHRRDLVASVKVLPHVAVGKRLNEVPLGLNGPTYLQSALVPSKPSIGASRWHTHHEQILLW